MNSIQFRKVLIFGGCAELCISYFVVQHYQLMFTFVWQDGWTPLIITSQNGHVQVVAELLQHGARVDLQNEV